MSKRLTMAQAVISFLKNQYTERDGQEHHLFEGCLGIFGHGNVAGIGPGARAGSRPALLSFPQRAGDGAHGRGASPEPAIACAL